MKPQDTYFSRDDRYSLGIDLDTDHHYASLPVSNGVVDYEEYFALTPAEYSQYLDDPAVAIAFIDECRRHEHDELLILKPGSNRGTPV